MTTYPEKAFQALLKEQVLEACNEEITDLQDDQGDPDDYLITHTYAGGHEDVLAEEIPSIDEAVDTFLSILNGKGWVDHDRYVSIQGNYKELELISDLYVEALNEEDA